MPPARNDLGEAFEHFNSGRLPEARAAAQRVVRKDAAHSAANHLLGMIAVRQGRPESALPFLRLAARGDPREASCRNSLGLVLLGMGQAKEAEAAFREAVAIDPLAWQARMGLGRTLQAQRASAEAERCYREAARLVTRHPEPTMRLGHLLLDTARPEESLEWLHTAARDFPDHHELLDMLCCATQYVGGLDPLEVLEAHRAYGRALEADLRQAAGGADPVQREWPNDRDPDRPLRIGYLSPDLRAHSIAYFLESLFEHHRRDGARATPDGPGAIELYGYSTSGRSDAVSARLKAHTNAWRDLNSRDNEGLVHSVRTDRIDILVEVVGHMRDHSLPAVARRLAPVQVTYLDYPATTGVPTIDYRLVDIVTDPPGDEVWATERLMRLPGCYLCYRPDESAPPSAPPPAERAGHITFGSFNACAKLGRATLDLWGEVMRRVPESRLLLKNDGLSDPAIRERVMTGLSARGVDRARVECLGYVEAVGGHLGLYSRIDIGLDTTPFSGVTTTCEAMWMGVPVLTLRGTMHGGRMGASLLTALGLEDLIAETPEAYANTAAILSWDSARRAELRISLRDRMRRSALCDGAAYARKVEAAYRAMWRAWCRAAY